MINNHIRLLAVLLLVFFIELCCVTPSTSKRQIFKRQAEAKTTQETTTTTTTGGQTSSTVKTTQKRTTTTTTTTTTDNPKIYTIIYLVNGTTGSYRTTTTTTNSPFAVFDQQPLSNYVITLWVFCIVASFFAFVAIMFFVGDALAKSYKRRHEPPSSGVDTRVEYGRFQEAAYGSGSGERNPTEQHSDVYFEPMPGSILPDSHRVNMPTANGSNNEGGSKPPQYSELKVGSAAPVSVNSRDERY